MSQTLIGNKLICNWTYALRFKQQTEGLLFVETLGLCPLTLAWSVMLQIVITASLAKRKSSVTFSPRATEQRVSKLLRTTSLSALLVSHTQKSRQPQALT